MTAAAVVLDPLTPAPSIGIEAAKELRLVGTPRDFGGYGTRPMGEIPTAVLTAARKFLAKQAQTPRAEELAAQVAAIDVVTDRRLRDRMDRQRQLAAAKHIATAADVTPSTVAPDPDKDSVALVTKRLCDLLEHPEVTEDLRRQIMLQLQYRDYPNTQSLRFAIDRIAAQVGVTV